MAERLGQCLILLRALPKIRNKEPLICDNNYHSFSLTTFASYSYDCYESQKFEFRLDPHQLLLSEQDPPSSTKLVG